jgi:hypothetical protein
MALSQDEIADIAGRAATCNIRAKANGAGSILGINPSRTMQIITLADTLVPLGYSLTTRPTIMRSWH